MFDKLDKALARLSNGDRSATVTPPNAKDVVPKAPKVRARLENRAGMTLFTWGSGACGVFLVIAAVIGTGLVMAGVDPRPYMALLPLFYAPMLLGGVAWLVWMSDPARKFGRKPVPVRADRR
jgi:hypothetical protein